MKFKKRLENIGLNYKKEIAIYVVVILLLITSSGLGYFFLRSLYILVASLGFALIFTFIYFSRYSSMEEKQKLDNINDFINVFTFFKTYIKNDYNIYSSLKEISTFSNQFTLEKLNILINEIDNDKTVEPFIRFARNYDLLIIEQLMISVFQMVDQGNNSSYINQFDILFSKLKDEQYQKDNGRKEKRLSSLTVFPMIGSGYLIIVISVGVVQMIGEMLSGL